jgi:hypothetical protein
LTATHLALLSGCCCLLASCNPLDEKEPITETREISKLARPAAVDVPAAKRFYDNTPETPPEDPNASREHPLVWTTPEGWTEKPPGQMRLIDMSFGPGGEGECYVSAMPGAAGGLAANINRWRGQVGQPPLSDEEIDKLPRKMFLGAPAHFVSADGDFKNVGEETSRTGYRLLGLIHQAPDLTLFVKMTGPQALVEQNTAAFEAFCQSVQFRRKSDKIPTH